MHSWNTFGARTSHGQTRTHKTHHSPNLGEATTFSLIVYYVLLHEAHIQMAFFVPGLPSGSPKIAKVGTPTTLRPHNFMCKHPIEMRSKQSYSPCQELSNGMLHATYTQGDWIDSQLLMVGSQTANLTFGLSFGHNLCFRCPNG